MELNNYLNFDSNVAVDQRYTFVYNISMERQRHRAIRLFIYREDSEFKRNHSLDDFFQDFQEIISSEMKPITTTYNDEQNNTSTNIVQYDPSAAYKSTISGVDLSLDLTQFYINTNEAEFLNADELKTDFSSGLVPFQLSQFTYPDKAVDEDQEFSVIDLSTGNTEVYEKCGHNSVAGQSVTFDNNLEFSAMGHSDQSKEVADYSDTKMSISAPLNQFYFDFNGETSAPSDPGNSIVTYISKDALQSVEYINESGQTETVMYVDQQSDEKIGGGVTQYEIIDFDGYHYQTENVDHQPQYASNSELIPEISSVPHCADILSTLLSDKSNKITIISKPMRNPKVRQTCDEFYQKFLDIDLNPTNIKFAQQSKAKGCRKQTLDTINQTDLEPVEPKSRRPNKKIVTPAPVTLDTTDTTAIPETPKLPSKFMRDRRAKSDPKRKRPRKLFWDSDSDCENGVRSTKTSKST